ncbi:hypothetical protein AB0I35_23090 [Nocardia sp. NPDC050378]|uniref:hypothetical protein n=1 Tax=Nocardia sp. NPDC050378 TaxID=3155400 RepID=UPI0033C0961D
MVIFAESERPRVLVCGFDRSHPYAEGIEKMSGRVGYFAEMPTVRVKSWDVIVSLDDPPDFDLRSLSGIRHIQIGGTPIGEWQRTRETSKGKAVSTARFYEALSLGEELEIPDSVAASWRELVRTALVPGIQALPLPRSAFTVNSAFEETNNISDEVVPLVRDLDGGIIAMRYFPGEGPSECLYLPDNAIDAFTPWLRAAYVEWSKAEPDIFPAEPDWTSDPTWMTFGELEVCAALEDARAEECRVADEMAQKVRAKEEQVVLAREAADTRERMLLTGTDDALVDRLADLLTQWGFSVRNMDQEDGRREKLEDLRVSWGDGLTAIVEVKGYSSGGKPSDLQKIERFAARYALSEGRMPAAKWYVVNQFRYRNPSERRPLMRNHSKDVQIFAEEGGLVIDTRDLFTMAKRVDAGELSAEQARGALTSSRGFFNTP